MFINANHANINFFKIISGVNNAFPLYYRAPTAVSSGAYGEKLEIDFTKRIGHASCA